MAGALNVIIWNAIVAIPLALAVWLVCKAAPLRRRPALAHLLWLLVLVKLVTPPLVGVPLLPAPATAEPADSRIAFAARPVAPHEVDVAPATAPDLSRADVTARAASAESSHTHRFAWPAPGVILLSASLLASVLVWLAAVRQFVRVRRLLEIDAATSPRAAELLQAASQKFALRSVPRLAIVDASVAPLLWAQPGRATIVLPRHLADALDDRQLQDILAHELAHFVRRDAWTNLFAFAVATLFWWHPLAWLARREQAAAAEAACDALALARLAGSRRSYAQTLLCVADFASRTDPLRPGWAVAFGRAPLRKRFEMLADARVRPGVSRLGWALVALATASLVLWPARAQQAAPPAADASPPDVAVAPDEPSKYYVTGRVVDENGQPIAAAQVNFLVDSEQDLDKRGLRGTTDADGRYRVEVPLGSFKLWFPRLKPGYWLADADSHVALATTPDQPVVTHDITARTGAVWPLRVDVPGGIPQGTELFASVYEVPDDELRRDWLAGLHVSFQKSPETAISALSADGTGAVTQCGETGKLLVGLGGGTVEGTMAELLVEPGFDLTRIKSIAPAAETDKTTMTDEAGRTATIDKAKVTLADGRLLLTFHLKRLPTQEYTGRIVDEQGQPLAGVRVGAAIGFGKVGGSGATSAFATTGADGKFVFSLPWRKWHDERLRLLFNKDGYAGFDSDDIEIPPAASPPIDVGRFVLPAGHSLAVRVVDEKGKPLAGAAVEAQNSYAQRREAVRTDPAGRAILRNLPLGEVRIYAHHGPLVRQATLTVADPPGEETTLELAPVPAR